MITKRKRIIITAATFLCILLFTVTGVTYTYAEEGGYDSSDEVTVGFPVANTAGWQMIDGQWYYADQDLSILTGWQKIKNKWYYLDPDSGAMQVGLIWESDFLYYLDGTGVMRTGWQKIDNNWYYFQPSGKALLGWYKYNNKWYYMAPETGAMQTGWVFADGDWYYLNGSGVMTTGWIGSGNNWYYMAASGKMQTGWLKYKNKWYYLDPETGLMQIGWKLVDDQWYYMNSSGVMTTGWIGSGSNWYYMASSGVMQTGWQKISDKWYYLDPETGKMQIGWVLVDDIWYYMNSNGTLFTGWRKEGSTEYYLTLNGLSYTGLAPYGVDFYYVEEGVYDPTYNGMATVPGQSREYEVINGKTVGGIVAPSESVAKQADAVLNQVGWNLRAAFDWSIMKWTVYDTSASYGIAHYADYGFKKHTGNCYVMAATFVAMARELGYEAYQISGYVPSRNGGLTPHSWAEVKVYGKFYVFDPDFEEETGHNGYYFSYGTSGTWRYTNYSRMKN